MEQARDTLINKIAVSHRRVEQVGLSTLSWDGDCISVLGLPELNATKWLCGHEHLVGSKCHLDCMAESDILHSSGSFNS